MSDYRSTFIRDVEAALTSNYSPEDIAIISNTVIKALSNYEITERCTDLALLDDTNDKLLRRYRACLMVDGKSKKTIEVYSIIVRKLSDVIQKPFPEMGPYDIRFFLASCQEKGTSSRTLENYRAYISSFFQWLTDDEIIQKNPALSIKPIKYKDELRKAFSDVEVDALRGACNDTKERAIIETLLATGLRLSEMIDMQIKDVDFHNLMVHIVHGKGDKERYSYLTPVAAKYLISYLESRNDKDPYLFSSNRHEKYSANGMRRLIHNIGVRAKVDDVHPHRFRRTFATNLSKRGMEIHELQKLLGHSDIQTTMIYVETDASRIQSSYRRYTA